VDISGAIHAANTYRDDQITLVGPESHIKAILEDLPKPIPVNIDVINAPDVITMTDKASLVGKKKPASSMHIGTNLVKDGKADAFVTAGNTGAAHAISMLFTLKRMPHVKRPALSAIFPIYNKPTIFVDVGANADARPDWLVQFAVMGKIYAERALHIESPRIGLLSNGEEDSKGTEAIQQASNHLRELPLKFLGQVEPKHILAGELDVVVCDGFTGNVLIKTFEASTRYLGTVIREEIRASWLTTIGGILARPAFTRARQRIDTFEIGGAPLLGVNGVVIISHGGSDARAIKNAVGQARQAVIGNVINIMKADITQMSNTLG